ncbi:MAG: hypothetical protein IJD20_06880 [Oscillospiraceae bacterium]|nr:hypothetical protein [Oscillospiraceae bacterium]MBR2081228.1 hypothetical protein [Oscillospiraceae bacterium]MBR2365578.1 hypothetical protein [Oscillospiraceae bacterium]MBR2897116.1 hypothetical protein [Oscillospiraceae bacterium]MBR2977419.1 hypothetical protein [Oscillospiraceae bacterium]
MVKVIMGLKGSGKTKQLIQSINEAVVSDSGSVVCIEKGSALRYDVSYRCRLIDAGEYQLYGYTFLKGFICGLHAGNFDITKIFIDSFYKIIAEPSDEKTAEFLAWCDEFGKQNNMEFVISISQDPATAPEGIKKYL